MSLLKEGENFKLVKLKEGYCSGCEDTITLKHYPYLCRLCYGKFEENEEIWHEDTVSVSEDGTEYGAEHYHKRCWEKRDEFYKREAEHYDKLGKKMDKLMEEANKCPDCKSDDVQDLDIERRECRKCNRQWHVMAEYERLEAGDKK